MTTIFLDIFEDQLELGRLTLMSEASALLDQQLGNLNRVVLNHGGQISREDARARAEKEYEKFKARQKAERHKQADATISELKKEAEKLPKRPRR